MSKLETNTIDTISGSTTLTLGGTNANAITIPSGVTLTVPNGGLSGQNYPAFEAYLSANATVTNNTATKIAANTEVFDTNGYYDNSVNYRFTPLVAGKYMVYAGAYGFGLSANNLESVRASIYKNGSIYRTAYFGDTTDGSYTKTAVVQAIVDMNGSTDYLEAYALVESISGANPTLASNSIDKATYFGAYRIGA